MVTTLCLLNCVLAAAQPAERTEWLVLPRLSKAQELVYRGTAAEESHGQGLRFTRTYRLESRVLVLDQSSRGYEVAFLTMLKVRLPTTPFARSLS